MSKRRQKQTGSQGRKVPKRYFRRLQDGIPVEYCVEACQPVHSRYSDCRQCEQSCPLNALRVVEGGVEVDATCLGCGQCAAACPTGALGMPGFALPDIAPEQHAPLLVDCWKVPYTDTAKDTVRVPCLGGLSLSRMIELRVAAGNRPIRLLDRGWCENCATGNGDRHPASRCTDAARELLQAMRIPAAQWPVIESRPLPSAKIQAVKPERSSEQRLSRRAFFGDLAARVTNTASEINPLTSGKEQAAARGHEREPLRSRERDRLLHQVRALSAITGSAIPAALYPAVQIDLQRCGHHQLCAVTCPTGALSAFHALGVSGVAFDSSGCIACGHCETICAESALRMFPQGDGKVPAGIEILVRVRQEDCSGCGRPFRGVADDALCPSCNKRWQLAASAFQTLFGRPN